MKANRILSCLGAMCAAASLAPASPAAGSDAVVPENNSWPLRVERQTSDGGTKVDAIGPFFFSYQSGSGDSASGFRPFLAHREWKSEQRSETDFLYPLFISRENADQKQWSVLNLINFSAPKPGASPSASAKDDRFDLWPIYFSRQTGSPENSYRAVFPIYGVVKNRLGNDRMEWVLFPLYGRFQAGEKVVTTAPWPFIKIIRGGGHHGFFLWPLAGWREQEGKSRSQFYLWPLIYKSESDIGTDKASSSLGVLPFYSADRAPGYVSETYLWPFFGYTERTQPVKYSEQRYLWPFFVQGRGDERMRNRWAPFYTHSIVKGSDKTWVLWPLFRTQAWNEAGLDQRKTQFLFFLYWSLEQRKPGHPEVSPARKYHVWPLVSVWNNGAGREQVQLLSPLEVFFQHNDTVRLVWSPLFALYRYDRQGSERLKHSFLWNAVSYEKASAGEEKHLRLAFLASYDRQAGKRRFSLLGGLFGLRRNEGTGAWKPFAFDFNPGAQSPNNQP